VLNSVNFGRKNTADKQPLKSIKRFGFEACWCAAL